MFSVWSYSTRAKVEEEDEMIEFPDKKYQIIYADLPLTYNDKALAGKRE